MNWFANIKTGTKLTLSFGIMLLIMATIILSSYSLVQFLNNTNRLLYEKEFKLLEDLERLRSLESNARTIVLTMLMEPSKVEQEKLLLQSKNLSNNITKILNNLSVVQKEDVRFITKLENLKTAREEVRRIREERILPLVMDGKIEEAKTISREFQNERYERLYLLSSELTELVREEAQVALNESQKRVELTTLLFVGVAVFTILLVIGLIQLLKKQLTEPLQEVSIAARRIALGDLSETEFKNKDRRDEVGILLQAFTHMSKWLSDVAKTAGRIATGDLTVQVEIQSEKDILGTALQQMIKNLNQLSVELTETIDSLSASASEISAATAELAAGASETATSVSETTSTIEQVKQTSHLASQKAKGVLEASQRSNEISKSGKKASDEITEMTLKIHSQMELIAESMVKLSEQSQAIGVIIETVENLSGQSNLLAVNASIEAAKAGDQGKGFSVVAEEVKSLANQSQQATREVRSILSDIQKAAGGAIMATEQGSKAVELGVKKSSEAGQSILTLINCVVDGSNAATQIAASSHQQLVGMEQAAIAMENIKQASQQNVESTEQLKVATSSIKGLAEKLQGLVRRYKVN